MSFRLALLVVCLLSGGGLLRAEVPITFDPQPLRTEGDNSTSLATGDFNEDGIPDAAMGNRGDNTVSIFLGEGDGTFRETVDRVDTLGVASAAILTARLDGDAHLDLAVANMDSASVSVLLGDGTGGFEHAAGSPFLTGTYPRGLDTGDLDRDGHRDLVVATRKDASVWVYLGDGTGVFTQTPCAPHTIAEGLGTVGVRLAHLNGDALLDFVAIYSDSHDLAVFLNQGDGCFTGMGPPLIPVGNQPKYVVKGFFNMDDPYVDLAVVNQGSQDTTLLLGDGAGGFDEASGSPYPVSCLPRSLCRADFDRDGRQDLMVANSGACGVTLLRGDGRGGFRDGGAFPADETPLQPSPADFDLDFRMDLAVANREYGTLTTLINTTPAALLDLEVGETPAGTVVTFGPVEGALTYDVIRGRVEELSESSPRVGLGEVHCQENDSPDASTTGNEDADLPLPGTAFFYLGRYDDGWVGSYGPSGRGHERIPLGGDCPE